LDNRLFFPATKRNSAFIGDVLSKIIKRNGSILEIGSGSGEHGVVFQKRFPEVIWQTSDPKLVHRKSISSWIEHENLSKKMPQPLVLDVEKIPWEIPLNLVHSLQGIVSINMIHVAEWTCTIALFKESAKLLKNRQFLILYGPFRIGNKHTSKSNYLFDNSLKCRIIIGGLEILRKLVKKVKKMAFFKKILLICQQIIFQ
jgi:hypothetical protein